MNTSGLELANEEDREFYGFSRIPDEHRSLTVFLLDEQGITIGTSDDVQSFVGYSAEQLNTNGLSLIFGHYYKFEETKQYMFSSGITSSVETETWLKPKDGEPIPVTVRTSRIAQANGSDGYVVVVTRAGKEGIESVLDCGKAACLVKEEYRNKLMVAAHDTRGPLATVRGYLSLLEKQDPAKARSQTRDLLRGAISAADRLEDIVKMIGKQSKGEDRKGRKHVFLSDLAKEAAYGLAHDLTTQKTVLTIDNLGTGYVRPGEITEVFQNLIENAIKYGHAPDQPARIRITLGPASRSDSVQIVVADKGPGIGAQDQARLFEMFQKSSTAENSSLGLGLSICKRFVENNGGSIWVESRQDKGSRFCFTLPRRKLLH